MFEFLIKKLKAHPRKIVFTEGTDPRILEASARLLSGTFLTPVLVGNLDEIQAAAEEAGFNIRGAEIIDPEAFPDMEKMVSTLVELRKGKMSEEECRKLLKQANYFGTMLVKMGYADALLGGATYSTADTVRPALQIIKTKPGNKIVSSCFILVRPSATGDREVLAMGDCAINIKPSDDELVEIALETAKCAKIFGIDPKESGEILLDGKEIHIRKPMDAIKAGIVLAPEDRKKDGLCTKLSIRDNIALPNLDILCNKFGVVNRKKEAEIVERSVKELTIKLASSESDAGSLSGGNQQKVVIGRALSTKPKLVILDEPTRGIDAAARGDVYSIIAHLRDEGVAVLLISSDMEEIVELSDRAVTVYQGRINAEFQKCDINQDNLMAAAFGVTDGKKVEA